MQISDEAIEAAKTAYREKSNYSIVPSNHDDALAAAVTAALTQHKEGEAPAVNGRAIDRVDANGNPIPWAKEHDYFMGFDPENPNIPTD